MATPIIIRHAHPADCDAIAGMVRELARDTGAGVVPRATGAEIAANLFGAAAILSVLVAEERAVLAGYCMTLPLFSTWRNSRGLHVVDLYVKPELRSANLGLRLLRRAAADGLARGATFIRLEVERGNVRAERFYERLGFRRKDNETRYSLDEAPMQALAHLKEPP